ncbi:hypothetical protein Taro_018627 [Colocasia esculenta]|uniref:Transcription repressor n=1 Tax=Colocasia esculenta TaxID=4460 RepID=A0A843UWT5_COLES|nr:hypothetical protein [Colocasia esculenta]
MDVERLEGRRLKQRISKVLWASLRSSSCSITSREVAHAVHEPVFVPGLHGPAGKEKDALSGFQCRSLVTPLPFQHRCLRMQRREMGAAGSDPAHLPPHRRPTTATTRPGRKSREKHPRASRRSPSYYCSEKMGGELEREEKRIAVRKKEVEEKGSKKKLLSNSYGFTSSSSEDSDNDDAVEVLFASDETETLFSSRSFSSDSSEFYYSSSCRCSRKKKRNPRRQESQQKQREEEGEESRHCGTWVDGFRPFVFLSSSSSLSGSDRTREDMASEAMEEEEEMEAAAGTAGFAVEKQSSDPREDFRSSMLEMIMEKQVFGDRDLENLLVRYLSLNHPHHHPVILEVFSEIRETLFGY